MVAPGHSAYDPGTLGLVLARHALCSSVAPRSSPACPPSRLVSQSTADLFRYACLGSSAPLADFDFLSVAPTPDMRLIPTALFTRLIDTLAFAA